MHLLREKGHPVEAHSWALFPQYSVVKAWFEVTKPNVYVLCGRSHASDRQLFYGDPPARLYCTNSPFPNFVRASDLSLIFTTLMLVYWHLCQICGFLVKLRSRRLLSFLTDSGIKTCNVRVVAQTKSFSPEQPKKVDFFVPSS